MKEEASPRETAHLRSEMVGRKQQVHSFVLNNSWMKLSPDLATCSCCQRPLPYPVPALHWLLRLHTCICSCQICRLFCFTHRSYQVSQEFAPSKAHALAEPYRISGKEFFLFSIHGSHGKSLLVATHTHTCLECKHFTKRRTLTVAELIYYTCVGSGRCG